MDDETDDTNERRNSMASDVTVLVVRYTKEQGEGWAVEVRSPHQERRTDSRWTERSRAIREGQKLAEQLGCGLAIY